MKFNLKYISYLLSLASVPSSWAESLLDSYLRKEFSGAMVRTVENTSECKAVKILPDGIARLLLECENGGLLRVKLEGKIVALVPNRRIGPGENLREDQFERQELDLFHPSVYPYRNLLISNLEKISNMESRQTLLAGLPLLSSHFSEKPLIRLGESVAVRIRIGDLSLQTTGIAQEKGLKDANIRVLTKNTKKDLVGRVMEDRSVEVNL